MTTRTIRSALAFTAVALLSATVSASAQVPGVGELGGPSRALSPQELTKWLRGREIFDRNFHQKDGVGTPELNADSCRACHEDPVLGGAGGLELNVSRFGNDNGGQGPFTNLPGGQVVSKLRPAWVKGREEYDPMQADVFEQRQTPALFGAGLIDTIPEYEITAHEDPTDADGDGIFGVARRLDIGGFTEIGRFGWKAQVPLVGDFIKDAMGGECGITTPNDGRGFALVSDNDPVADPELSARQFDQIHFFLSLLAAPRRKGSSDPRVAQGDALFRSIGCAVCHLPELQGTGGPVPLYSNLLLHDVHPPSFRGMEEPGAPAGFFRTPPLWGCRETEPYLHDGRAETLRDAIAMHDGEALQVRQRFMALSAPEQEALMLFLRDL